MLHITSGSGTFFMLLAVGLILSRLVGSRSLREGKIVQNASAGMLMSMCGYLVFTAVPNLYGYYAAALMIGLGNGHMYPAMQTMFINLAPHERRGTANSTILTSWDLGVGIGIIAAAASPNTWAATGRILAGLCRQCRGRTLLLRLRPPQLPAQPPPLTLPRTG